MTRRFNLLNPNKYPHSRSLLKFLLFPKKQLKYAFFHFLIVCSSVIVVNFFSYLKFRDLAQSSPNNTANLLLIDYVTYISKITLVTMAIMGPITFLLVIVFLHRFVGPVLPIQRHLDAILDGNFTHRSHKRSADEISEVVEKLNAVSNYLEDKDKNKIG